MYEYGAGKHLVRRAKNLYARCRTYAKWGKGVSEYFEVKRELG